MSHYTTEVRYICEVAAGKTSSVGYDEVNSVLDDCIDNVFNFDYPIFDEAYRPVLEKKILKHYYTREIAFETVGLWKLKLETRLNEIMPYYNQLYATTVYDFNPLYDVDYYTEGNASTEDLNSGTDTNTKTLNTREQVDIDDTKTKSTTGSGSGTVGENGNSTNTDHTTDLYADTPQGAIITIENQTPGVTIQYMTNARTIDETHAKNYSKNGTNSNQYTEGGTEATDRTDISQKTGTVTDALLHGKRVNGTKEYIEHVYGKKNPVPFTTLLTEFRKSLINIDMMIIDDLKDLFFMMF